MEKQQSFNERLLHSNILVFGATYSVTDYQKWVCKDENYISICSSSSSSSNSSKFIDITPNLLCFSEFSGYPAGWDILDKEQNISSLLEHPNLGISIEILKLIEVDFPNIDENKKIVMLREYLLNYRKKLFPQGFENMKNPSWIYLKNLDKRFKEIYVDDIGLITTLVVDKLVEIIQNKLEDTGSLYILEKYNTPYVVQILKKLRFKKCDKYLEFVKWVINNNKKELFQL